MRLAYPQSVVLNGKQKRLSIMQIREKGKKVLCIRTEYRPLLKRTVGVTVASQDKYLTTVSEEVCRHLEKTEVEQLEKWLSDRTETQTVGSLKSTLSFVSYSVRRASEALSVDTLAKGLTNEKADEIWRSLEELQKALRKAGFKRPGRQTVDKSVIN